MCTVLIPEEQSEIFEDIEEFELLVPQDKVDEFISRDPESELDFDEQE